MVLVKRSAGLVKKREIIIDKTIANLITQYLNKIYPVSSSSMGTCAITLFTGPLRTAEPPPSHHHPYSRFFARAPPFFPSQIMQATLHTPDPARRFHALQIMQRPPYLFFTHFLHPATLASFQILRLFRFPPPSPQCNVKIYPAWMNGRGGWEGRGKEKKKKEVKETNGRAEACVVTPISSHTDAVKFRLTDTSPTPRICGSESHKTLHRRSFLFQINRGSRLLLFMFMIDIVLLDFKISCSVNART